MVSEFGIQNQKNDTKSEVQFAQGQGVLALSSSSSWIFFHIPFSVFICERTRRRTLRESFRSRMTIFSGILLGLGSVGMIIGYSAWKQMPAQQRREGEGQKEQYASLDY